VQSARYRVATSLAPVPPANVAAIGRDYFAGQIPHNEQYRPHFGRGLNLDTIDQCIRAANAGMMSRITDLSRETISLDGQVIGLLQKRLNRICSLEHQIEPANGPGIDDGRAKEYAAHVRENIAQISNWRDRMCDIAWGVFDGRSASEIEWQRRSRILWARDLHWIHPRRISFGPDRDLRVIEPERQIGNFYDIGFPLEELPYKFVTFRPRMFGDYQEREGLAYRTLYWSFFGRCGTRERLELMEIFGKPWRILIPKTGVGMPAVNVDALQQGFQALTLLGFHNTARMPANVDVQVVQPEQGAGQVHADVIHDARDVLSIMYTGHVITTSAAPTGLGSGVADRASDAFELLIQADAGRVAETIEDKFTDAMIAVNYGPEWMSHAPRFKLITNPPGDSGTEAENIDKALKVGLRVAEEEARKRTGFREVRPDEPYLVRTQRPAEPGQIAPPPGPELVFPLGKAPVAGELIATPDVPINPGDLEGGLDGPPAPQLPPSPGAGNDPTARAALPSPGDDTDEDDDEGVAALAASMTELGVKTCEHGKRNRCRICGIERDRKVELDATGEPLWGGGWKPIKRKRGASRPAPGDPAAAGPVAAVPERRPSSPLPGGDPSPRVPGDPSPMDGEDESPVDAVDDEPSECPTCGGELGTNAECETCKKVTAQASLTATGRVDREWLAALLLQIAHG